MSYARDTNVSTDRSRAEIERTLDRFGATGFLFGWHKDQGVAMLGFEVRGRQYRFRLDLPDVNDPKYQYRKVNGSRVRHERTPAQIQAAWEQDAKERWRALALYVKATLAAVEAGVILLEDALLAHTVLPDNSTVGTWLKPQLDDAQRGGRMPPMLPGGDDENH